MKYPLQLLAGALLACSLAAPALAAPASVLDRPAMASAKASRALLLDAAVAGTRLVAVGERGHIVFSEDQGKTWQQAKVPVSVMLTSVHFPTANDGWAVGHHGVILSSKDGGKSWALQRADRDAASEKAGAPLLGVWFADAQTGFAVGAYGYFLATQDGGATWTDNSAAIANPDSWHLNDIHGIPGTDTVFIVGEQGKLFRSTDRGASWRALASPFDGSFFGVATLAPDLVLVAGLQGQVYASADQGNRWQKVETGVTSGLNTATRLADGRVVVAGNAGVVLASKDATPVVTRVPRNDRRSITALVPLPGSQLLAVGEGGASILTIGNE